MGNRIANVVFDAPGETLDVYAKSAGAIAGLYAELLGARRCSRADSYRESGWPADEGDELDPLVLDDDAARPNLAFEYEQSGYRPPRWPDPAHPQQVHLDVAVADLDTADAAARAHGATRLAEFDDHRVYADAVGHPFCLFPAPAAEPRGRIHRIVFDCFSPRSLAGFYRQLLDLQVTILDTGLRVEIGAEGEGVAPTLAFQHVVAPAPRWPDPAYPQQVHLDLGVEDPDEARALVERLGGIALPYLGGGIAYADPAGHPFCVCD